MKHLIFSMSLLALVSCKDNKQQETENKTEKTEQSMDATKEDHHDAATGVYANAWVSEIQKDKGAKWQADELTNEGVKKMQTTIETQSTNTLSDYHKLAKQLNDDKNYVVKNCTMEGASHDNLHIWLMPLIEKIDALTKIEDVDDAAKLKQSIEENISAYDTYFQ